MFLKRDEWAEWDWGSTWLDAHFAPSVLQRFDPDSGDDWFDWLDQEQSKVDGKRRSSVRAFEQFLFSQFSGVVVYHATRLPDLQRIREEGIRAWTADELRGMAQAEFGQRASPTALSNAIESCLPEHRGGRVYSFASLTHALGTCSLQERGKLPSFASKGGEFLRCVGMEAGVMSVENQTLSGRAFLLECCLPWDYLESDYKECLLQELLETVISARFCDTEVLAMTGSHVCVASMRDISPTDIMRVADLESCQNISVKDITWHVF